MGPKKGAGIYNYYKQSCEKKPPINHQPSPITPQIHIQLPELQQFSKEKRISQFKQSKTLLSKKSVRNTASKKEALKRAENPKPKKTHSFRTTKFGWLALHHLNGKVDQNVKREPPHFTTNFFHLLANKLMFRGANSKTSILTTIWSIGLSQ
jgi:hypothetical protein